MADVFPDSTHVYTISLDPAEDLAVWNYAQQNGFIIVTKDSDFDELLTFRSFPPKVIWIRRGNCSTTDIENILRSHLNDLQTLANDPKLGILSLY